ncbi:hypothetical protein AAULH_14241, partial [Lactobacillus helveticus MTCC 5463]
SGVATPNTRSHLLADEIIHQSSTDAFSLRDMDSHLDPELAQLSEREVLECELIRRLISSYFDIVRQTTQDQVPKV